MSEDNLKLWVFWTAASSSCGGKTCGSAKPGRQGLQDYELIGSEIHRSDHNLPYFWNPGLHVVIKLLPAEVLITGP